MNRKVVILVLVIVVTIILGVIFCWQYREEDVQSSITLISPNGGEVLVKGSTYIIEWKTENVSETDRVAISIRRVAPPALSEEGQEFDPIIFTNLENTGSKEWVVSSTYPDGNYIIEINTYESLPIMNPISDESDTTFKIVDSATS